MDLTEALQSFLQDPTRQRFLTLQELVLIQHNYSPDLAPPLLIRSALEQHDYALMVTLLKEQLPGGTLSPSLHKLLALAYERLGKPEAARIETHLSQAALTGILMTGDGSRAAPWRVLRVQDEYDVLAHLGRHSAVQRLFNEQAVVLDQHRCDDDSSIWFDVSLFFHLAGRR